MGRSNMQIYEDSNCKITLDNTMGKFYKNNKLIFSGNSKIALKKFIDNCEESKLKNKLIARYRKYDDYYLKEKVSKPVK